MDMLRYLVVLLALASFISCHPFEKAQEDRHRVVVRTLYVPLYNKGNSNISPPARKALKSSTLSAEFSQEYDTAKTPTVESSGRQQSYYNVQPNNYHGNSVYEQNYQKNQPPNDKRDYYTEIIPKLQSYSQQSSSDSYRQQQSNLPAEQGYAGPPGKLLFPSTHASVKEHVHQEESLSADPSLQYGSGRTVPSQGKSEYVSTAPRSSDNVHGTWSHFQTQPSQSMSFAQNGYSSPGDIYRGTDSSQPTFQMQQKTQNYQPSTVTNQFYSPQTNHQIYQQSTTTSQTNAPSYQSDVVSYQQQSDAFHNQRIAQHQSNVQQSNSDQYRQQQQTLSLLTQQQTYAPSSLPDPYHQNVAVLPHHHNSEFQKQHVANSQHHSSISQIQAYQPPSATPQNPLAGHTATHSYEFLTTQQQQPQQPQQQQGIVPLSSHIAYPLNSNIHSSNLAPRTVEPQQISHSNSAYPVSPSPQQNSYSRTPTQLGMQTISPHAIENVHSDQSSLPESQKLSSHYESSPYTQQITPSNQQSNYNNNLPSQNTQLMVISKSNILNQQSSEPSTQQMMTQYENFPLSNQEAGISGPQKPAYQSTQFQSSHSNHNNYPEYNVHAHNENSQLMQTVYNSSPNHKQNFQDQSHETYHTNPRQVYTSPPDNYQVPAHQQQVEKGTHQQRQYDRDNINIQNLKKMYNSMQDGVLVHRLLASNSNQQQQPIHQGFQGFATNRNPSPHVEISLHNPQNNGYNAYKIIY